MIQKILIKVYSRIFRKWLERVDGKFATIKKVTGWRSCIVDDPYGGRSHSTFCFWGLD